MQLRCRVAEFVQSILSLETELLKSPASQKVHEGDFLLSCHHYILYFPACCNFKECCFISRFNSSCPTWETNEVSLNAIIATAAICFLQVDVLIYNEFVLCLTVCVIVQCSGHVKGSLQEWKVTITAEMRMLY